MTNPLSDRIAAAIARREKYAASRARDLQRLWPQCYQRAKYDLHWARRIFFFSAIKKLSWRSLGRAEVVRIVMELQRPVGDNLRLK